MKKRFGNLSEETFPLRLSPLAFRFRRRARIIALSLWLVLVIFFVACEREKREFRQAPPSVRVNVVAQSDLQPGSVTPPPPTNNPDEDNAVAVNEGKRLFDWYNCTGCHAHGGGAIGPPLMDEKWIYGSDPAQVFSTIVEGRPNGMPSFRQKIPDAQVWELVAYVRSMSGLLRKDVSPTRDDHMNAKESEQRTEEKQPLSTGASKSSEQSK
ncbi:MAG TPA: cytochrome c [Pyrinomonadaceae bacterium]|nr:cytochrome c [Pyrinomonadaceae bacterium]